MVFFARIKAIVFLLLTIILLIVELRLIANNKTGIWTGLKAAELLVAVFVVVVSYFKESFHNGKIHFLNVLDFIGYNHKTLSYYLYIATLVFGIIGISLIAVSLICRLLLKTRAKPPVNSLGNA